MTRNPYLFRELHDLLLDRALRDGALEAVIAEIGARLTAGGVPIHRMNVGGFPHPKDNQRAGGRK
mgnify:CR=1 FL=1